MQQELDRSLRNYLVNLCEFELVMDWVSLTLYALAMGILLRKTMSNLSTLTILLVSLPLCCYLLSALLTSFTMARFR